VFIIQLPDSADFIQRLFIADMASNRIRRIGWINDNTAITNYFHRAMYQAQLRTFWMYFKELSH